MTEGCTGSPKNQGYFWVLSLKNKQTNNKVVRSFLQQLRDLYVPKMFASIDPLGQPTIMAGSDHYFLTFQNNTIFK